MKYLIVFCCCLNIAALSAQGISNRKKCASVAQLLNDSIPSLGSFVVYQNGKEVYSGYFNGADSNTVFSVKSVSKSIMSSLVGLAYDRKLLNPDQPVLKLLPLYAPKRRGMKDLWYSDFIKSQDSLRYALKVHHLLTMQSGFLWDDNNPLIHRAFQCSSDPVKFMMELSFGDTPGSRFNYCTGNCQIVSKLVSRAFKKNDYRSIADSLLFKPAGIKIASWALDPTGLPSGGSEMYLTANNMVRFGLLYLNEGVVNEKALLSKEWIKLSTSQQAELKEWDVLPGANGYGYYWWRRMSNGHQVYVASGYGGQLICIIPDLKAVVVTTCFVNELNRGRSEIKRLHLGIDKLLSN